MGSDLTGSTGLITGGNSGIGRAVAFDLAAHGAEHMSSSLASPARPTRLPKASRSASRSKGSRPLTSPWRAT
jgi:NAD(P)-dependent dehydrogenase (short-subunit alcohol dehydrogenase family)